MSEYVCECVGERVPGFSSPVFAGTIRERVVRCRDCARRNDDGVCLVHIGAGDDMEPSDMRPGDEMFCSWGVAR